MVHKGITGAPSCVLSVVSCWWGRGHLGVESPEDGCTQGWQKDIANSGENPWATAESSGFVAMADLSEFYTVPIRI